MSTQPAYASTPIGFGPVNSATANTNRDGTGTINQLAVGKGMAGTRIERVLAKATVTTTAGMIRIFKKGRGLTYNADGTIAAYGAPTWRLIAEIAVSAITVSASVAAWSGEWAPGGGYHLAEGEQLGWAPHNAESFNCEALGGNL